MTDSKRQPYVRVTVALVDEAHGVEIASERIVTCALLRRLSLTTPGSMLYETSGDAIAALLREGNVQEYLKP